MRHAPFPAAASAAAAMVIALLLLLGTACSTAVAQSAQDEEAEDAEVELRTTPACSVYRPTGCWYRLTKPEQPPHFPACMKGHNCGFDLEQRLACPFWAAGTFAVEDKQACATPFVAQAARPRPTCHTSCCTSDPGPGAWRPNPAQPGHKVFQPDSGCEYFQYNRREVLEYFQAEATDILVVGDSIMRQLFVRLLHLLRGQDRVVDYKVHTHATYATCDAADAFAAAPGYDTKLAADKAAQRRQVDRFFRAALNVSDAGRWRACSKPPMQVHYMFGSTFAQQFRNLERYSKGGYHPHRRVDVIISVMFWTHVAQPPQLWLDALAALKAQRWVRRVFLLAIPTARVVPSHVALGYHEAYRNRNRIMRQWAANQTRDAHFIDFDELARAPNPPAACEAGNKHYACHLRSLYGGQRADVNYFREPHLNVPLGDFFSSEDGQCFDDMDAMLWQLYFNVAMKPDLQGNGTGSGHTRRSGLRPRQPSAGDGSSLGSALESAADRFIDRVVMRGVT